MLRAIFSPVLVSSIFLAPFAYGSTLQPGPPGTVPNDKSIVLTFDASADTRASYLVDNKGFYDHNFRPTTGGPRIGGFAPNDQASNKGSSPPGASASVFNSRGASGSSGSSFSGLAGFLSSSSGEINSFLASKGFGEGSGFGAGNKGLGLLSMLPDPGFAGPGSEGSRGAGPSVSATPLPASWTMMIIGLLAFGLLALFRRPKISENPPHPARNHLA